jgi:hypothetical protein
MGIECFSVQDGITLYMVTAGNSPSSQVWQYGGTPYAWALLTGPSTTVHGILVATNNRLYMYASNGGPVYYWIYDGTPYQWSIV